jgi:hypothetical protein
MRLPPRTMSRFVLLPIGTHGEPLPPFTRARRGMRRITLCVTADWSRATFLSFPIGHCVCFFSAQSKATMTPPPLILPAAWWQARVSDLAAAEVNVFGGSVVRTRRFSAVGEAKQLANRCGFLVSIVAYSY